MGLGMGVMGQGGTGVLSMSMVGRLAAMGVVIGRTLDGLLGAMGDSHGVCASTAEVREVGRGPRRTERCVEGMAGQSHSTLLLTLPSLLPLMSLINAALTVLIDLLDDVEWLAEQLILPSALSPYAGAASALHCGW